MFESPTIIVVTTATSLNVLMAIVASPLPTWLPIKVQQVVCKAIPNILKQSKILMRMT